jgi:hypothetical protein
VNANARKFNNVAEAVILHRLKDASQLFPGTLMRRAARIRRRTEHSNYGCHVFDADVVVRN